MIAVCGMPGSGKEEFVQVAKSEGINVIRMGDVVREEVNSRKLPLTDQNVGEIANSQRKAHGLGIWADRTLPRIEGDLVLIDGIRGDAEIHVFKSALKGDFILVGIQSSKDIRFERIKKRARIDAPVSWEQFCERDFREMGWGIEKAMALCQHVIVNEGTLSEFQNKVRDLLRVIKEN